MTLHCCCCCHIALCFNCLPNYYVAKIVGKHRLKNEMPYHQNNWLSILELQTKLHTRFVTYSFEILKLYYLCTCHPEHGSVCDVQAEDGDGLAPLPSLQRHHVKHGHGHVSRVTCHVSRVNCCLVAGHNCHCWR